MGIRKYVHTLLWVKRHIFGQLRPNATNVVIPLLGEDSVCFDVGAHSGAWSYSLSKKMRKGSIYAFEGFPYYADLLAITMKVLGRTNVHVVKFAVSDKEGVANMVWKDSTGGRLTGRTHIEGNTIEEGEKIEVKTISLDYHWNSIGRQKVEFVKMDVEGAEFSVLKGARDLIDVCRPIFYNELEGQWCERYAYTPADIFNFFADVSYVPYLVSDGRVVECDVSAYSGGDILFVPNEKVSLLSATLNDSTRPYIQ